MSVRQDYYDAIKAECTAEQITAVIDRAKWLACGWSEDGDRPDPALLANVTYAQWLRHIILAAKQVLDAGTVDRVSNRQIATTNMNKAIDLRNRENRPI